MLKFNIKLRFPIILLAATILLIFLHYFGFLAPLENILVKILGPIQYSIYSFAGKIDSGGQEDSEKIRGLMAENERLKLAISEFQSLEEELIFLKEKQLKHVMAKVLIQDIAGDFQGLIINAGEAEGIKTGMPVIFGDGILIGKIAETKKNFSKVILLTDVNSQTAAAISSTDQTAGIVNGESGSNLKMELIPKDREMKIGDIVITSGLEPKIPKGLIIGEVARIDDPAGGFFKTAYLKSIISLDKINIVAILLSPYDFQIIN